MNSINDTIVALCSGAIKSAISVIRVSGNDSFNIVNSIFSNKKEKLHQKAYYGFIKENDEIVDEVMVTYYVGPKSFTAEDMVEISCHGNMYIVSKIIELIISNGARLAENGEFTKRAFLFNRIDLVNAESINDLINANSKQAVKLAMSGLNGLTSEYVLKLSDDLLNVISQIIESQAGLNTETSSSKKKKAVPKKLHTMVRIIYLFIQNFLVKMQQFVHWY